MTNISEERPVLSGRYELHRRIARGGMAEVFLARDQLLDRPVAVKVLFPQYAADPTFVARFRREAQAAANLNHPSVVAVYDWGHQDDTYFIVMEYVEGQSLAELLAEEGTVDVNRALEMVGDVAAALGFAHRNGTVHRDVKPGNIMITNDDQVKVADFGIARAFGGADDQLTQTGSVMGTASYFSPEQAQGKQVDPRSDLYSLGVVLFEMVTGQTPFAGESPVAIAYKHVQETPPRPSALNPNITPELESIIARLLAKNPDQRYDSAEDFRADLDRYRQGQPLISGYEGNGNGDGSTLAMNVDATRVEPASRAVIDTTRAVPASVASGRAEPVEEYYEQPNRTGVFLVMLLGLLVVLVGLVVWIITATRGGDEANINDVDMPNVVGLQQEEATNELIDLELEVEIQLEESEEDPGTVIGQDPAAEEVITKGDTVTLTVSQAAETVTVPNVVDLPLDEAEELLRDAGFEVQIERQKSDTVDKDTVISVTPGEGEEANEGQTITIVVSEGGETVTVPQVQGDSQTEASNKLSNAEFRFNIVQEPSATVPENQAIRTDPAAGQSVAKGSRITLFISSGTEEVAVPNVVGMTQAAAEAALSAAGFTAVVVEVEADAPGDVGNVVAQNPAAGTNLATSETVTIDVAIASEPEPTTTTVAATTTAPPPP